MRSFPQLRQYSPLELKRAARTAPSWPRSTLASVRGRLAALIVYKFEFSVAACYRELVVVGVVLQRHRKPGWPHVIVWAFIASDS